MRTTKVKPHSRSMNLKSAEQMLKREEMKQPEWTKHATIKWGFDLTGFKTAEDFQKLLDRNNLQFGYKETIKKYNYSKFHWNNRENKMKSTKHLELITEHNPLTGEATSPSNYYGLASGKDAKGRVDKGYAGYIGIEGSPELVLKFVKDLKASANEIKDESKYERDFI